MNYLRVIYTIGIVTILISCGNKKSTNIEKVPDNSGPVETVDKPPGLETFKDEIKEQLFFHFRSKIDGLEDALLVTYENIDIDGNTVEYQLVTVEKWLIENVEDGFEVDENDSITIKGEITIIDKESKVAESDLTELSIHIEGYWHQTTLSYSPYEQPEPTVISDSIVESLKVRLKEIRKYSRDEMHLKARIFELDERDLAEYTKDELAYLRNELFARHGHSFKTDKMNNYFNNKSWYLNYLNDATPFLNDTEKRNAQFIKELESKI